MIRIILYIVYHMPLVMVIDDRVKTSYVAVVINLNRSIWNGRL